MKWDVKDDFAYVLQFFSLISGSLGSVTSIHPYRHLISKFFEDHSFRKIFYIEGKKFYFLTTSQCSSDEKYGHMGLKKLDNFV